MRLRGKKRGWGKNVRRASYGGGDATQHTRTQRLYYIKIIKRRLQSIYLQSLADGHILPSCHRLGCSKDNNEINLYLVLVQLFDQNIHSGEERAGHYGRYIQEGDCPSDV